MPFDFLWQQGIVFLIGMTFSRAIWLTRTKILRHRARVLFGNQVTDCGVSIVVQTLSPLSRSNFDSVAERTMALKIPPDGSRDELPIYADVVHLDDYRASQEVVELLRELRLPASRVVADADVLGEWARHPSVVCIGSPFVNAALADAIMAAGWPGGIPPPGSHRTQRAPLSSSLSPHP